MQKSKVWSLSDLDFRKLVNDSYSYSDILRELNLTTRGGSSTDILKQRIKQLNIDTSHFSRNKSKFIEYNRMPIDKILVKNSTYHNIARLKRRLINENILEYKCGICRNEGIWNGKKLSLQLHHINGINNDHRISNLMFLCPNCHSTTETYSGKNQTQKSVKVNL